MRSIRSFLSCLVPSLGLVAACTTTATPLQVHRDQPDVDDTHFDCTGTWPGVANPCEAPWSAEPYALALDAGDGAIEVWLGRAPMTVDGGETKVRIDLELDGNGAIASATAIATTTPPALLGDIETTDAIGGSITPVEVSTAPGGRNAGTFELEFPWGTISGSYDTIVP
ncbi:MAG: hypothetical protein K8W52_22060 [Deltaproteobacteria bacterium]|nr:hypothetical protein [Deltaproteobacteria bacterium]